MAQICTVSDVRQLGVILGVWAHPDDETFTSAGIMAAAAANGQTVVCVTATRGENGLQDESKWPSRKLSAIRQQELEAALAILGVEQHHWLDFQDNCCGDKRSEGVLCICRFIDQYRPDTILTFGADGLTGHDDHKAVCLWAIEAARRAGHQVRVLHAAVTKEQYTKRLHLLDEQLNIFFNVDQPKLVAPQDCAISFELSPQLKSVKFKALQAMPSQTAKMLQLFDQKIIEEALSPEAFVESGSVSA